MDAQACFLMRHHNRSDKQKERPVHVHRERSFISQRPLRSLVTET